jgi:hypothetical protein
MAILVTFLKLRFKNTYRRCSNLLEAVLQEEWNKREKRIKGERGTKRKGKNTSSKRSYSKCTRTKDIAYHL